MEAAQKRAEADAKQQSIRKTLYRDHIQPRAIKEREEGDDEEKEEEEIISGTDEENSSKGDDSEIKTVSKEIFKTNRLAKTRSVHQCSRKGTPKIPVKAKFLTQPVDNGVRASQEAAMAAMSTDDLRKLLKDRDAAAQRATEQARLELEALTLAAVPTPADKKGGKRTVSKGGARILKKRKTNDSDARDDSVGGGGEVLTDCHPAAFIVMHPFDFVLRRHVPKLLHT